MKTGDFCLVLIVAKVASLYKATDGKCIGHREHTVIAVNRSISEKNLANIVLAS